MPLTDTAIRSAKPRAKTYKLFDGGGLHLEVNPAGGQMVALEISLRRQGEAAIFGVYPEVGLKAARKKRDDARYQLGRASTQDRHAKPRKSHMPARKVLRPSPVSGTRNSHRDGWRATATASCVVSKSTSSLGSASGPSPKSKHRSCSQCCVELKAGAHRRLPTGRCRTADRYSATPWRPDGRSAIPPAIFAAPCPRQRKSTTPRSSNRSGSPNCCARLIRIGFLRYEMCPATGTAGLRAAWRIAQSAMARDRLRQWRMAHPCRTHEDAGTAYSTAVASSR